MFPLEKSVRDLFNRVLGGVRFDKHLFDKLAKYRMNWINKNPEHIEFLGGNLFGVHIPVFSANDDDMLVDLFRATSSIPIEFGEVGKAIIKMPEFKNSNTGNILKVASNPYSQLMFYTAHRFAISDDHKLDKKQAIQLMFLLWTYRRTGSIFHNSFEKYRPTEEVAKAVYEELSNRFLIKEKGTWDKMFEHQAQIVTPGGIYYQHLKEYSNENSITIINGADTRLKSVYVNIFSVLANVTRSKNRIGTDSMIRDGEDGEMLKDVINTHQYVTYIERIAGLENELINETLINLVHSLAANGLSNQKRFIMVLRKFVEMYNDNKIPKDFLENVVVVTIEYIGRQGIHSDYARNIAKIIKLMSGFWKASSVVDAKAVSVKKTARNVAIASNEKMADATKSSFGIALILYITFRAIIKDKY